MPCFHPVECWYSKHRFESGKNKILYGYYDARKALNNSPCTPDFHAPCRQCVGCRLERSRQWAMRCLHEAQMHKTNSFITLTFSPENLEKRPNQWSLDHTEYQKFMKRLKSAVRRKHGSEAANAIRFYMCGEYGEKNKRPHYHACIFGFDFPDKNFWKATKTGEILYTSDFLNDVWGLGYAVIGNVTFESAAYVARYIMKKVTGDPAEDHYNWIDTETGEIHPLQPEYNQMSRSGGIGSSWLEKYMDDVYPHDYVVINGKKMKPPKYYDGKLETQRPYEFDELKFQRAQCAEKHLDNNTPERLNVREKVQLSKLQKLPRDEV